MRKLLPFTLLAMLLTTGVAAADRGDRDHRRRGDDRAWRGGERHRQTRVVVRDRRHHVDRTRAQHRPVYIRDGAFHFHGGIVKRWRAPVITRRYVDIRFQPAPVAESYETVPGYVWRPGQWQWTGYEWSWTAGFYDVAPDGYGYGYGYQQGYDHDGDGYVDQVPAPPPPPPPPYRY